VRSNTTRVKGGSLKEIIYIYFIIFERENQIWGGGTRIPFLGDENGRWYHCSQKNWVSIEIAAKPFTLNLDIQSRVDLR
jgi:hypothetical protein